MDGILNVNKPAGKTSFGVVAIIRRLSGERRVGHAGTLDPAATGVLPVCLGQATRVAEYLMDSTKKYRADIGLGITTDTYDAAGTVEKRSDISGITRAQLEEVLNSFRGKILQTPPMYSALKHRGKPLYELARNGITIERQQRQVEIYCLEILKWRPPVVTVDVVCSKGTYVRSLAHDIGQALGCGAIVQDLIRLKCGTFEIENAVSITELETAFREGYWQRFVYPMDHVLADWRAETVSDETAQAIRNGRPVDLEQTPDRDAEQAPEPAERDLCRIYTSDGRLLSLVRFEPATRQWHPVKVFQ
ncbi:MAG TPA: tRNA pseudouridine(55) synthase TruB [Dehalococcoidia bacterium]|nr:tRNA pseudouridine(55) synthase TruB [Dehalococcoidia bacterium]